MSSSPPASPSGPDAAPPQPLRVAHALVIATALAAGAGSLALNWRAIALRTNDDRMVALTQPDAARVDRLLGAAAGAAHAVVTFTPPDATVVFSIPPGAGAFMTCSRLATLLFPRRVVIVVPDLLADTPAAREAIKELPTAAMVDRIPRTPAELRSLLPPDCYLVDVHTGMQLPDEAAREDLKVADIFTLSRIRRAVH